jgi:hypothetical protein
LASYDKHAIQSGSLTQQALDTNQQPPLASAPSWGWNSGRPISDADWFSRYISTLKTRTDMVLEKLVFSPLNQLTRLVAREYFIIQCRRESYKSYFSLVLDISKSSCFNTCCEAAREEVNTEVLSYCA